jgi:antitoxin Phd
MKHWPVQDAKARFSELLRATLEDGPQMVTLRGRDAAVLVPAEEWAKLAKPNPDRSALDALLGAGPRFELPPNNGALFEPRAVDLDD